MSPATESAEQLFRSAFERLKVNAPSLLPAGTAVSQNNVAREAGTDPSALRKTRYPALIREIQAWVEINERQEAAKRQRKARVKRARKDLADMVLELKTERDLAQSQNISAQRKVLELLQENARLRARLDDLLPPPERLYK